MSKLGNLLKRSQVTAQAVTQETRPQGVMAITKGFTQPSDLDVLIKQNYPNWVEAAYSVAAESPSVREIFKKGGVSNALLSTMETIQSAYVAPSISGIGPAKQMLTEWWFNPIWGQPRLVDLRTIKQLSRGHFGSMAVEAILDQVMQIDWDIVPKYRHTVDRPPNVKAAERSQRINVEAFLQSPNRNKDNWDKILRMMIRNILETDDGVLVKVYQDYMRPQVPNVQVASTGDIRAYTAQPAWDAVPVPGSPLIEVYAEDGSSFLKQVDMHGYLMNYWQYSFIVPRRPVRFEANEIVYIMQNPRAGSPYGYSPFESIVEALRFMGEAMTYGEHFFANSAVPALQIDYPWIKSTEELEEMGRYLENNFMGPDKAYRTLVTNGGSIVKVINWNPQQLQMLEMQEFYLKLILAKLKVPPSILGLDRLGMGGAGGRGAGQAQMASSYRSRAIKPLISLVEHALNGQLLPDILGIPLDQVLVEFRWGEMVDIEERERQSRIDQVQLATGVTTVNEVRIRDGSDPVAWGNMPFIPAAGLMGQSLIPVQTKGGAASPSAGAGGQAPGGGTLTSGPGLGGGSGKNDNSGQSVPGSNQSAPENADFSRPTGLTQAETVRSISHSGGRGPSEIPGGVMKSFRPPENLDALSNTIGSTLMELLKEAKDRLQDHENFSRVNADILGKARGFINAHLPENGPAAAKAKNRAISDFQRILVDLNQSIERGEI